MQLVWLDLGAGKGGSSHPARDRGWLVKRVDINPDFEPDIVADLTTWNPEPFHVDLLFASSVCTDFTKWGLPASWACNRGGRVEPDLTLSLACKRLIDLFKPGAWVFENVLASRPFLTPVFGPVRAITAGHAFWGNFPGLLPKTRGHKWKLPPSPDRAAIRAMIPYEIGETLCRAVEGRASDDRPR